MYRQQQSEANGTFAMLIFAELFMYYLDKLLFSKGSSAIKWQAL
jgi:hypothetical protein